MTGDNLTDKLDPGLRRDDEQKETSEEQRQRLDPSVRWDDDSGIPDVVATTQPKSWIPACAGMTSTRDERRANVKGWIPAFAGMTSQNNDELKQQPQRKDEPKQR